ncbi:MAG: GAF domain-containing protein [Desulfobacterales bacterium]
MYCNFRPIRRSRAIAHDMLKIAGIGAVLAVPVMVHDTLSGVLLLFAPAPRTFNAGEIAFLTALADQGASPLTGHG